MTNKPEFINMASTTRVRIDRTAIDLTTNEFKDLLASVLNDQWSLDKQTTDADKLAWVTMLQNYLAVRREQDN